MTMKKKFLVAYDYGQGGVWAFLLAESEEEISRRYPSLTIVKDPPPWFDDKQAKLTAERMTVDIDDQSHPLLAQLLGNGT